MITDVVLYAFFETIKNAPINEAQRDQLLFEQTNFWLAISICFHALETAVERMVTEIASKIAGEFEEE